MKLALPLETWLMLIGSLAGLTLVIAAVAWRLGRRAGLREWKADATRAFRLGVVVGRREDRGEADRE